MSIFATPWEFEPRGSILMKTPGANKDAAPRPPFAHRLRSSPMNV
jgi:hypothetical protein